MTVDQKDRPCFIVVLGVHGELNSANEWITLTNYELKMRRNISGITWRSNANNLHCIHLMKGEQECIAENRFLIFSGERDEIS